MALKIKQFILEKNALKPKTVGVELVGSSVKLEGSILSNFSTGSYAKLPFTFGLMDKPWSIVLSFKYVMMSSPMGMVTSIGSGNGWSPMFIGHGGGADTRNKHNAYLNGVGWPVTWSNGTVNARSFTNGDYCIYVAFDGVETYATGDVGQDPIAVKTSSSACNGQDFGIQIGTNRGGDLPFYGTVDLSKSYVLYGGELLWEGELGAYGNVQELIER